MLHQMLILRDIERYPLPIDGDAQPTHEIRRNGGNQGLQWCSQVIDRPSGRGDEKSHVEKGERSEEHTSELQSLMRNSYAVFCLKKKKKKKQIINKMTITKTTKSKKYENKHTHSI